jgi:hypothetical protein
MPRFTVKDLLISTALVACGLGTVMLARRIGHGMETIGPKFFLAIGFWGMAGATAGAGLFYPITKTIIGVWVGIIVAIALILEDVIVFYNTRP